MPMPDAVKNQLEDAVAKIQGEVGRFLILKERIRALPESVTRTDLLMQQDKLEKTALALISRAQLMKDDLSTFNPFDLKQVASIGPKVSRAVGLVQEGAAMVLAMQDHKARVEKATGGSPLPPESAPASSGAKGRLVKGAVLAAVVLLPLGFIAAPALAAYWRKKK